MNAVAEDQQQDRRFQRLHGVEKAALEQKLNDWGEWLEARLDFEGYPGSDTTEAARSGAGGRSPGHRVLCPDMPDYLWSINQRILRLPEHEHAAVEAWYIPRLIQDAPREYLVVDLEQTDGTALPRRWLESGTMVVEVDLANTRRAELQRFVIYAQGGAKVATADTRPRADLLLKSLRRKDDLAFGRPWTTGEKAERLGITVNGLFSRLHRARLRLLGLLPLFVGIDCQKEVK